MSEKYKYRLTLQPSIVKPPTRTHNAHPSALPHAKATKHHPKLHGAQDGKENAILTFIGTATTIIQHAGLTILTDPNFLHAGDHVHLGPGVTATRLTDPSLDIEALPHVDAILLSHYHADHFDEEVEAKLRRDLPIVTTKHARECLVDKKSNEERFTEVYDLDFFESAMLDVEEKRSVGSKVPAVKVTGMPGKHVPPGPLSVANDLLNAIPPTNGWMVELGNKSSAEGSDQEFHCGYRIYISGDTLMIDELKEIPERYQDQNIDLMLIHLGGTTIPSPSVPLLMVTMDATQGIQLMQLVKPEVTIPIHYDDYDVFLSPLDDFKEAVESAGWTDKVVYLDRAEEYRFTVREK